ncbi:MAG: hypothetical protein V2B13_18715 [Pseudomonadota bacterium]
MITNKIGRVILGIVTLGAFLIPTPSPVMAQREGITNKPAQTEALSPKGITNGDHKVGEWEFKHPKKPVIAGIPLGAHRSEITSLLISKQIAPLQRTAPMDSFPRLIGEISYIKKAYLYYTRDRLSKLTILFDVPVDKNLTGEPLLGFYKELREKLIRDYGQPTNSTAYVHPNFPYTLVALETGNAFNLDYWENVDDMKILLSLKGREEKIDFSLTYQYLYFESDLYLKTIKGN